MIIVANCFVQIVTEESARLNIPNEKTFAVDANHSSICKFASVHGQTYQFISRAIAELVETVICQQQVASQANQAVNGPNHRNYKCVSPRTSYNYFS